MANYLVTGAAGFIAYRVTQILLDAGHSVTGVDNLNDAYDVRMKNYRIALLEGHPCFSFHKVDITDRPALEEIFTKAGAGVTKASFDGVINLAARAGVRQSLEDPWVYVDTNMTGTLNLLELSRRLEHLRAKCALTHPGRSR
jgi:UDP-glucuronate 4-epimerase